MSRTSETLFVPIPAVLPGVATVTMVASVYSLSDGEVKDRDIEFISGPTWITSPYCSRRVFFQKKGTKPDVNTTFQQTIKIRRVAYDIYLEVDAHNKH